MDPRTFAPWLRGGNSNTLQMGVMGRVMHVQAVAFIGGRSPDPMQRAGMAVLNPLVVEPAATGRSTIDVPPGSQNSMHASAMVAPNLPAVVQHGPFDPFLGRQFV